MIRDVAKWKLGSNENILHSLLIHGHDMIAADHGHDYRKFKHANFELMKFAIDNENEMFLKHALKEDVFDGDIIGAK